VRFNGITGDIQNGSIIELDNGNVGIGIASPISPLHIQGNIMASMGAGETILGIGTDGTFNVGKTATFRISDQYNQLSTTHGGTLRISAYHGQEFLRGTSTVGFAKFGSAVSDDSYFLGNLGVGTNNPTERLEVNGKIKATSINFTGLPTSTVGLVSGDIWSDGGTLKIMP
jgi:hypothetical protein